ncbi:hypothetical protein OROGR_009266 [Orobanche gracilis]
MSCFRRWINTNLVAAKLGEFDFDGLTILVDKRLQGLQPSGNVLQVSDIIEHNGVSNGPSVIVLLAFLSVQLLVKRNMLPKYEPQDLKYRNPSRESIMSWWQDMAQQNGKFKNAAIIIQSHYRRLVERRNYKRIANAALVLQTVAFAWLSMKKDLSINELRGMARGKHLEKFGINKEEGYFIASELLKRICASENGAKAICESPAFLRRLNDFAESLASSTRIRQNECRLHEYRNARNLVGRENTERRYREVVELLKLIKNA